MSKSLLTRAFKNFAPVDYTGGRAFFNPFGVAPATDMDSQMAQMASVPTLFAIVDRLASSCAAVRWGLYKIPQRVRNTNADRTEVKAHPALSVWNKPNPYYTQAEFVEAVVQHYDLTGEMWWILGRNDMFAFPIEMWPVRPDRMRPVPSKTDFIAGYLYRGEQDVPLDKDDVILTKRQNPRDPYRGISPVASLIFDLEGERAASIFNAMFFRNSAMPGGVIEAEEMMSDNDFKTLKRRWAEQHQGIQNAHRVAILEKAKFHELRYTNRDMEFVELRRFSKEQIRQAYGFPKPLLGDVDDVNRANAEAAEVVFARWLINPRLDRIKEALNTRLLPLFGEMGKGYEFDYDDPAPEDAEGQRAERDSSISAAVQLINAGFDPTETLSAFGLPEIPFVGRTNAGGPTEDQELPQSSAS